MKALLKPITLVISLLLALLLILGILRVSEKVVVTDKPAKDLNALILSTQGVTERDDKAWEHFTTLITEPAAFYKQALEKAGGDQARPADWPQTYVWPFEFSDAIRANAPDVVTQAASRALDDLRSTGFFDRLAASRLGPPPILQVRTENTGVFELLLPELAPIRSTARTNACRMKLSLDKGDEQEFLTAVRDNRFIARVASHEFLIGTLVGYAVDALTLQEIRLGILEHHLSAPTLRALDEVIQTCSFHEDMRVAFNAERIGQQDMIQRLFTDNGNGNGHIAPNPRLGPTFTDSLSAVPSGPMATLASFVIADRKENEAAFDDFRDTALAQLEKHSAADIDFDFNAILTKYPKFQYPFIHLMVPAIGRSTENTFALEAEANATRIMIALELHHLATGADPATLDALVPDYLPQLPPDTISGKPWIYKPFPTPDEFGRRYLLYSVGIDQIDNDASHAIEAKTHNAAGNGKDYILNRPRE